MLRMLVAFCIFALPLWNTQWFRWHLGYCLVDKTTKFNNLRTIGTLNAHAVWRGYVLS